VNLAAWRPPGKLPGTEDRWLIMLSELIRSSARMPAQVIEQMEREFPSCPVPVGRGIFIAREPALRQRDRGGA
jgi:hypothetical protein